MTFLRYISQLSLVVWVGGIMFFAFVLAPTAFSTLPSRQLAGLMVGKSLQTLHWMGVAAGATYLVSSGFATRNATFPWRAGLVLLMILLTLISQLGVIPKMDALRAGLPDDLEKVPADDPARSSFDALHRVSTKIEGGVLLLGLVTLYLSV